MNHKQLEYFLETAKHLSVTKAAQALFISQPSLSEQIKNLEKELDATLFIRRNKKLELTLAGQTLVREIHELFDKEQELIDAVHTASLISKRTLKIHYLQGPFEKILPNIMKEFKLIHPEIMIDLQDIGWNDLTNEINTLDYDIMFYLQIGDVLPKGIHSMELKKSPTYIVVSENHPLASYSELIFDDFRNEFFATDIQPQNNNESYHSLYNIFKNHKVKQPNLIPARNVESSLMTIRSGMAIGVLSPDFLSSSTEGLVFIPCKELPECILTIYWNPKNTNPYINDFMAYIKKSYHIQK